jgi:hypothetical protein
VHLHIGNDEQQERQDLYHRSNELSHPKVMRKPASAYLHVANWHEVADTPRPLAFTLSAT